MTPLALAQPQALEPVQRARRVIARHSKSFSLAARVLPSEVRDPAVLLYAYCRRVDDAIDGVVPAEQAQALAQLWRELDDIYDHDAWSPRDPDLAAFARLVQARKLPRRYLHELLLGMQMDACGVRYERMSGLLRYAYRVAGTVGLLMCHVLGVRRDAALAHAAHLGIAMQLTNIARDVLEDWNRGRLYLPNELLAAHGAPDLRAWLGGALPPSAVPAVARATLELLDVAEAYYRSGERGLSDLSPRCAFAVHVARLVYGDIGRVIRARAGDPFAARAVVSTPRKLWLLFCAASESVLLLGRSGAVRAPDIELPLHAAALRVEPSA